MQKVIHLTNRKLKVIDGVKASKTNLEISRDLNTAKKTMWVHILKKLSANTTTYVKNK